MNVYRLLRAFGRIKSPRLKLLALWALHVMGRRYVGVFLDPVLACNLRCKMCYFSDDERRKELHGRFSKEQLQQVAQALFPRALKLQIGCGAEPTLFADLPWLVREGKTHGVPYVSVTTNGQLLTEETLRALAKAGLDELTISLHGLTKETYENLMQGASFEKFKELLGAIRNVRKDFPRLKVRVNYTLNADNVVELSRFGEVFTPDTPLDILQLRPIQKIGNSSYSNFSMQPLLEHYDDTLLPLASSCKARGIVCLMPTRENILALADATADDKSMRQRALEELTYCNVTPGHVWQADFDVSRETFNSYSRRNHRASRILQLALGWNTVDGVAEGRTKKLNYTIE